MEQNSHSDNSVPETSSYISLGASTNSSNSSSDNVPGTSGLEQTYQLPSIDQKGKLEEKIEELQNHIEITNKMIDYESICQIVNELRTPELKRILYTTNREFTDIPNIRDCILDKLIDLKTLIPLAQEIMEVHLKLKHQQPSPLDHSQTSQ